MRRERKEKKLLGKEKVLFKNSAQIILFGESLPERDRGKEIKLDKIKSKEETVLFQR